MQNKQDWISQKVQTINFPKVYKNTFEGVIDLHI